MDDIKKGLDLRKHWSFGNKRSHVAGIINEHGKDIPNRFRYVHDMSSDAVSESRAAEIMKWKVLNHKLPGDMGTYAEFITLHVQTGLGDRMCKCVNQRWTPNPTQ